MTPYKSHVTYAGGMYMVLTISQIYGIRLGSYLTLGIYAMVAFAFGYTLKYGKARQKLFVPLLIALSVLALHYLFSMLQLTGANILLLTGTVAVPALYIIRFASKHSFNLLDFLKVIFVTFTFTGHLFYFFHWPYGRLIQWVGFLSGIMAYVIFIYGRQNTVEDVKKPRTRLNIDDIQQSETVGCFSCKRIYPAADVTTYDGATALCTHCHQPTLIGSHNYNVTTESIDQLHKLFGSPS